MIRFKTKTELDYSDPISTSELHMTKVFWVRVIQRATFPPEFKIISENGSLPASHSLSKPSPFTDATGILRVGRRLQASSLPAQAKHPAILPQNSPFSQLILSDAHFRSGHGDTQLTLCFIREKYWILGGRIPVRKFILRCVRCARYRQMRAKQFMGQLPKERINPARPFLHSGVDYAGPISIKTWKVFRFLISPDGNW